MESVDVQLWYAVRGVFMIGAPLALIAAAAIYFYWRAEYRAHFRALSPQGVASDQRAAKRALRRTNAGPAGRAPVEDNRSSLVIHRRILGQ